MFANTGKCEPPRPQGPVAVAPGKDASVDFKNVFDTPRTFKFTCDSECFAVVGDRHAGQLQDCRTTTMQTSARFVFRKMCARKL